MSYLVILHARDGLCTLENLLILSFFCDQNLTSEKQLNANFKQHVLWEVNENIELILPAPNDYKKETVILDTDILA